jgi:hypothetical protein
MPKNRPTLNTRLMVVLIAVGLLGGVSRPVAGTREVKPKAPVPETGQTTSYAEGDDGDLRAGVAWPTPRFTDRGDGTVRDHLTGLIWLQDASCVGDVPWAQALTAAHTLGHGQCGLTDGSQAGEWRVPNIKELYSLFDLAFFEPAVSNAAGTAPWTEGDAFSRVQPVFSYWSSTTVAQDTLHAWYIYPATASILSTPKSGSRLFVWPVRGGE